MVSAFHRNRKALAIEHIHKLHPMDPPLPKNSQKKSVTFHKKEEKTLTFRILFKRAKKKIFPRNIQDLFTTVDLNRFRSKLKENIFVDLN